MLPAKEGPGMHWDPGEILQPPLLTMLGQQSYVGHVSRPDDVFHLGDLHRGQSPGKGQH